MTLLAIPNVSEGRDASVIGRLSGATRAAARLLDVHADPAHNRTVLTVTGNTAQLIESMVELAREATSSIDLTSHVGVHPRLGALDVCPFIPHDDPLDTAIAAARQCGQAIHEAVALPVYFYGAASTRPETTELADVRRGDLGALADRARSDLPPDLGGPEIDPRRGVVCVGARGVLIAFNVWLACEGPVASGIARNVRGPGLKALGLQIDARASQVSMNLTDPNTVSVEDAFERVAQEARAHGVEVTNTEVIGLIPEIYLPRPDGQAARLLMKPGRSLESALGN